MDIYANAYDVRDRFPQIIEPYHPDEWWEYEIILSDDDEVIATYDSLEQSYNGMQHADKETVKVWAENTLEDAEEDPMDWFSLTEDPVPLRNLGFQYGN